MDQVSRGCRSNVGERLRTGGHPMDGTVRMTAQGAPSAPGTPAYVGASGSEPLGVGLGPLVKAFGPVQQHGSSRAAGRFASGLPARRRHVGRRQQHQQQHSKNPTGMAGKTVNEGSSSRSAEHSAVAGSPQRKRPTIKEFLGVNPADILLPLLSPPLKAVEKHLTRDPTCNGSCSEMVSPLAFFSAKQTGKQKPQQQKSMGFPSFLGRLLPLGGEGFKSAEGNLIHTEGHPTERQKQQKDSKADVVGVAPALPNPAEDAAGPPPGIIIRHNAPVVPAFNASEGNQLVWKPVVYESNPIYLLPNGSISSTAHGTEATTGAAPLRTDGCREGTLPRCSAAASASCGPPAASVHATGGAPPAVTGGHGAVQVPQKSLNPRVTPRAAEEANEGLLQPPTPLTVSSLPGEEDPTEENGSLLTNYQKYIKWKEQQRKQQLLYQQLRLQQQQRITAQWIKSIENLIPQAPPRAGCGPATHSAPRGSATYPPAWDQQFQEQHPYVLQQQPALDSRAVPVEAQQHPFHFVEDQQGQPYSPPQQLTNTQQQPFDLRSHPTHPTLDAQQHLQMLHDQQERQQHAAVQQNLSCNQEQQRQEYSRSQHLQKLGSHSGAGVVSQSENHDWAPEWLDQQMPENGYAHDDYSGGSGWQGPQQLEGDNSGVFGRAHDGHTSIGPSLQQFCSTDQAAQNGCSTAAALPPNLVGSEMDPAVETQQGPSSTLAVPAGNCSADAVRHLGSAASAPAAAEAATVAALQSLQAQGVNTLPSFFPQPAYLPQPPAFVDAMRPVPGAPFHPGFNYAEGISVHYNYYDAEEWTAKLQAAAAQREYSGSTQAAEQEAPRDASGVSLSANSEEEAAGDLGLKPLLTSKQRLPSGQVFAR